MDSKDIAAAARDRGLDAAIDTFPAEIVAAIALAQAQRAALEAMPLDPQDAP